MRRGSAAASRCARLAQPVSCSADRNACERSGWPRASAFHCGRRRSRSSASSSWTSDVRTASKPEAGTREAIGASIVAWRSTRASSGAARVAATIERCTSRSPNSTRSSVTCPATRRRILDALREAERAGADARRDARAFALRLSARGPAAAARRSSTRTRASLQRSRAQVRRQRRSPSASRKRHDGRRYNARRGPSQRPRRAGLPQAGAAELHGVRRGALLRAGYATPACSPVDDVRVGLSHLRGRLGPRTGRAGARGGRTGPRRAERLAVSHVATGDAPRAGRRARAREPDCRSST